MHEKNFFLLFVISSVLIIAAVTGFGLLGNNSDESLPPVVTNGACNRPLCSSSKKRVVSGRKSRRKVLKAALKPDRCLQGEEIFVRISFPFSWKIKIVLELEHDGIREIIVEPEGQYHTVKIGGITTQQVPQIQVVQVPNPGRSPELSQEQIGSLDKIAIHFSLIQRIWIL